MKLFYTLLIIAMIAALCTAFDAVAEDDDDLVCITASALQHSVDEAIWAITYLREGLPEKNIFCQECSCLKDQVKKYTCLADRAREIQAAERRVDLLLTDLKGE